MKQTVLQILTWWNGRTVGTWLYTALHGVPVGEDESGNAYYRSRKGDRRWVIYNGESEASRVPPDWHGWLHHTFPEPPTAAPLAAKPWERPHEENLTGSAAAYRPPGSLHGAARRPPATGDYEAWSPPEEREE